MPNVPAVQLNDGHFIPQLGFGVWQVPDDVAVGACLTAFEAGYRHIDTAALYENERGVGEAIAKSGIARDDLFITTKLWPTEYGYDDALRSFDTSMSKLGLDVLDLYLLHWQAPADGRFAEAWRALIQLKEEGRVRSIGVSNFHEERLRKIMDDSGVTPVINQIELHPWLPQTRLREFDAALGILTESWSPLASGELVNDPTLAAIGAAHGKSSAQVMIRWHLQLGLVVLPKSVTPARIKENIDVFDFQLSAQEMATIAGLENGHRTGPDPDQFL